MLSSIKSGDDISYRTDSRDHNIWSLFTPSHHVLTMMEYDDEILEIKIAGFKLSFVIRILGSTAILSKTVITRRDLFFWFFLYTRQNDLFIVFLCVCYICCCCCCCWWWWCSRYITLHPKPNNNINQGIWHLIDTAGSYIQWDCGDSLSIYPPCVRGNPTLKAYGVQKECFVYRTYYVHKSKMKLWMVDGGVHLFWLCSRFGSSKVRRAEVYYYFRGLLECWYSRNDRSRFKNVTKNLQKLRLCVKHQHMLLDTWLMLNVTRTQLLPTLVLVQRRFVEVYPSLLLISPSSDGLVRMKIDGHL